MTKDDGTDFDRGAGMSRVVETSAAVRTRADQANPARRFGARTILPGLGRGGVFALLLDIPMGGLA
jgi:hypothetical protein